MIPSSTNPTNPFTAYALEEGVPMTMLAHILNYDLPEDVAFAESRIRPQTMAAEDFLHDMGAISIFATDTQGMGRLAENVAKCWQLASVMKDRVGRLPGETTARADNERIKRYVAKYTINPAIGVGIADHVGSIEPGKLADLVLWPRASFGIKPWIVIKSGEIVWAAMGDGNASQINSEPIVQRPMWGALGTRQRASGRHLREPAGPRRRCREDAWRAQEDGPDHERAASAQDGHGAQRGDAAHRGRRTDLRGARGRRPA